MEQVTLYCREAAAGTATLQKTDGRLEIRVEMPDPGDGLYRAVLVGERGEMSLGVMEPQSGTLVLRRRPPLSDTAALGAVRCVRTVCSFPFRRKTQWHETSCPAELFHDPFFRLRLASQPQAWWQRAGDRLTVALPLKKDAPFPLESLFCFARPAYIGSVLCAAITFDASEAPVHTKNC